MIEQITNLRIKIDGLSQLIEGLIPKTQTIDFLACPRLEEELLEAWIERAKSVGAYKESVFSNSKEVQKAYDSLILAKAWLGKVLGELGEATPYVNDGKRKEVGDIEPTADKGNIEDVIYENCIANCSKDYSLLNHIEKIDWLREEIKILLDDYNELENNLEESFPNEVNYSPILWLYYINLCEARFWLGFELGRVRDSK